MSDSDIDVDELLREVEDHHEAFVVNPNIQHLRECYVSEHVRKYEAGGLAHCSQLPPAAKGTAAFKSWPTLHTSIAASSPRSSVPRSCRIPLSCLIRS